MEELDRFEDELIERYAQHPVLANIAQLSDEDFTTILLQRRFLSLAFTPAYDLAIDLLRDEEGLRIARVILREEYPDSHGMRSHREDMTADMYRLGVSREALVHTRPTPATKRAIDATFDLIADAGTHDDADLRVLTILRFWGEILVSVEYGRLWERMEPVLTQDGSRFYYPHHSHDAKGTSLATANLLATSHSDRLATRVWAFLGSGGEGAADSFREVERRSLQIKVGFYDQFLPALERVGI
ncbi:hypothetical protein J7E99_00405 [Streptomyces sp. ISL-44]|uniref:hypothetical protein n=1 Tax=Streptomyces sp. ISL-44 TaxID=2819184 RepID=UPI001BED00A4|nr:hypothetical protein [Streptomyces sp. ISL-44]MBT2539203.1 hypothetical protein [Streptomyces sp. ISL-44]